MDRVAIHVWAYRNRLLARPSYARALDEARPYRHMFPLGVGLVSDAGEIGCVIGISASLVFRDLRKHTQRTGHLHGRRPVIHELRGYDRFWRYAIPLRRLSRRPGSSSLRLGEPHGSPMRGENDPCSRLNML